MQGQQYFCGFQEGVTPTGWPHTAQLNDSHCPGPEAKPQQEGAPNTPKSQPPQCYCCRSAAPGPKHSTPKQMWTAADRRLTTTGQAYKQPPDHETRCPCSRPSMGSEMRACPHRQHKVSAFSSHHPKGSIPRPDRRQHSRTPPTQKVTSSPQAQIPKDLRLTSVVQHLTSLKLSCPHKVFNLAKWAIETLPLMCCSASSPSSGCQPKAHTPSTQPTCRTRDSTAGGKLSSETETWWNNCHDSPASLRGVFICLMGWCLTVTDPWLRWGISAQLAHAFGVSTCSCSCSCSCSLHALHSLAVSLQYYGPTVWS